MITVWFRLVGDIIVDAIDYEHDGYVAAQITEEHLPHNIYSGIYRWDGTTYVFDQDLYDEAMAGSNA